MKLTLKKLETFILDFCESQGLDRNDVVEYADSIREQLPETNLLKKAAALDKFVKKHETLHGGVSVKNIAVMAALAASGSLPTRVQQTELAVAGNLLHQVRSVPQYRAAVVFNAPIDLRHISQEVAHYDTRQISHYPVAHYDTPVVQTPTLVLDDWSQLSWTFFVKVVTYVLSALGIAYGVKQVYDYLASFDWEFIGGMAIITTLLALSTLTFAQKVIFKK